MFRTETKPLIGLSEIKGHIERCHELHLMNPEDNSSGEAGIASMRVDMAILIGMTSGLLASMEVAPKHQPENDK